MKHKGDRSDVIGEKRRTAIAHRSPVSNPDGGQPAWSRTGYGNTLELQLIARREPVHLVLEGACTRCD
jgi:hypothetical protein